MDLAKEIEEMKLALIKLAEQKEDPLKDPEVYAQSCRIDEKIVEFLKMKQDVNDN